MLSSKRIGLSHQLARAFAALMFIWAVVVAALTRTWVIPAWDLASSACFALVPLMSRRGRPLLASNWFVTVVNATLFLFSSLFGENTGTHFCFLPATALPFVLFDSRNKKSIAFGVLLPMALFIALEATDFGLFTHYLEVPPHSWVFWLTVISAFLVSFLSIYVFSRANERAEAELRKSEQRYSRIVEQAQEGIWVLDSETRTSYVNPALLQMLGYGHSEMVGRPVLDFVPEHALAFVQEKLERRRRGLSDRFEIELRRKDGSWVSVMLSSGPIFDENQKMVSALAVVVDLTQAKEREKVIEDQRSKMLTAAKFSALGEMAAGIAHEVNNPLMALGLQVELLKRQIKGSAINEVTAHASMDKMEATIRRVSQIIEGLKTFSRDEEISAMSAVPVSQILDDTFALCQERFRARNVALSKPEVSSGVLIRCKPVQISQVLLNLLNNSFYAVSEKAEKRVEVWVQVSASDVEIAVVDNGNGIPIGIQEKIFQPFFTTKPPGEGTGLGLSISKGIIEAHHGSMWMRSQAGETQIGFKLPRT